MSQKLVEGCLERIIVKVWSERDAGRKWRTVEEENKRDFQLRKTLMWKMLKKKMKKH